MASASFQTITPVDGSVYLERRYASDREIDDALSAATAAQAAWASTPIPERAALCTKAVDAFVAKADQHAEELAWQMGRPIRFGRSEVGGFEERARHMIAIAEDALARAVELPLPDGGQFDHARDHGRQRGDPEARQPDPAVRRAYRRGLRRGRPARRRLPGAAPDP
jgi:acyl-CoA reductase-like NAD-dependent aldehyde dehydrogenase